MPAMKLEPITPQEPMSSETIPESPEWLAQIKWDGVRVLTYFDGASVKLYNRKKHERTWHYPEIADIRRYCKADSIILDGEVIALGADGKPSFHEVMRRDGLRRLDRMEQAIRSLPIHYMVFDVLYLNGRWIQRLPLVERQALLSSSLSETDHVQTVASFDEGRALFAAVQQAEMEGIVLKRKNSLYTIGGKNGDWLKVKNDRDLIAVAGGVTFRGPIVNSVLFGLYDKDGLLYYIGHAGTGRLSQRDWQLLTERIEPLITDSCPFAKRPERHKGAVWLKPVLTAKLKYSEWTEGRSLRQPSIQAFVAVPPRSCVFEEHQQRR